ncbi:DUF499 domain-containing protein [Natronogracilivirga saccharolytica]|uniref:DUF499 domain-containing protein n=1 Tax=Natronogracilivirga saccharolytica TaxID=2812953 RepID=A0A8J7UWC2_9BACT|nr:DUF499 domain-containing protein [Natronogracilivirga saccharolytica]MBP3193472.1 DUF499 domain-containing protein [Natronogracilivirga saccharolytica]
MKTAGSIPMDNIYKALGIFIEAMRPYVVATLQKQAGDDWAKWYFESLSENQKRGWIEAQSSGTSDENLIDFHNLRGFGIKYKDLLRGDFQRKVNDLPTWLGEIADVRHKCTHYQEVSERQVTRAFENMIMIAEHAGMDDVVSRIRELQKQPSKKTASKPSPDTSATSKGEILPWFIQVTPHMDIKQDRLDESVFAANLAEVALGSGREVYRNPGDFFSKTYFTKGLRTLARRVIAGLNGGADADNRVISLQTGFGGGKTHSLISLYHLARLGKKAEDVQDLSDSLGSEIQWEYDQANIAVFTNATNDPTQGREVSDGFRIKTIWGELAWQLGGQKAYQIIRENDEQRISPKGLFKKVLQQSAPSLILIDELADYCHAASGVAVGKSSLGDQTISFTQELTEAIASVDQCVLVATLPASAYEVGSTQEASRILDSLVSRFGRVGADAKPVDDEEIFEVIRRRLFDDIGDPASIEAAIEQYSEMYRALYQELPNHAARIEYKELMIKSYPFHPELVDVFRKRWAAHHDFQRTRGVLRILASIVADLWSRQNSLTGSNYLIHTSDVNLGNLDALAGQLKKLHGNGYDAVMTADVTGKGSNAFSVDSEKKEYGKYNLAQGVATTVLLNSFGSQGANKGIGLDHIKLCALKPDSFNHNSINAVLDELEGSAHYLYYSTAGTSTKRYWFHTKPNINILVTKAANDVASANLETEIVERVEQHSRNVTKLSVIAPGNTDIPEQKKPTLIILHPGYAADMNQLNGQVRKTVQQIATKKGNNERIYRNTLLFLACTDHGVSSLKSEVKDFLACKKILNEYQDQLEADQKSDLRDRVKDASEKVERALVSAYTLVLKNRSKDGLQHILLRDFRNSLSEQISTVLFEKLKEEEWLLESVGFHLLSKNSLLPERDHPVKARDIYEAFLRYDDKPMITGPDTVQQSLLRYCREGRLAIAAGDGQDFDQYYFKESPPYFDFSDESYWVVHKDQVPEEGEVPEDLPSGNIPDGQSGTEDSGGTDKPDIKEDHRVIPELTISGKVDLANYNQLFSSFIMPLRDNNVEIEITIRAKSTEANPITENSQQYKIVRESARQLGLRLDE